MYCERCGEDGDTQRCEKCHACMCQDCMTRAEFMTGICRNCSTSYDPRKTVLPRPEREEK